MVPPPSEHRVTRITQGVILVVLVLGIALRSASVVVNAVLSLVALTLPALLQRDYDIVLSPWVTVWIAGALVLHLFGMVVLYDRVWWWDHLTHVVSSALVAGVGYAVTAALDAHSEAVVFPPSFLAVYILLVTLAAGVLWEVLEWIGRELARAAGMEPVLVVYGLEDTMFDLAFDAVGGVIAAVVGGTRLRKLVSLPAWAGSGE